MYFSSPQKTVPRRQNTSSPEEPNDQPWTCRSHRSRLFGRYPGIPDRWGESVCVFSPLNGAQRKIRRESESYPAPRLSNVLMWRRPFWHFAMCVFCICVCVKYVSNAPEEFIVPRRLRCVSLLCVCPRVRDRKCNNKRAWVLCVCLCCWLGSS